MSENSSRILPEELAVQLAATATPLALQRELMGRSWLPGKHLDYLNVALTDVLAGVSQRVLISMPPRHAKSDLSSVCLPVCYLGTYPDRHVGIISYNDTKAAEWGRQSKNLMSEFGPSFYGVRVSQTSSAADHWEIERHGGSLRTAGIDGSITGRGFDLMIIDDPVKNDEEAFSATRRERCWNWWQSTSNSRLEPGAAVIVIMTRWHADDLAGRILEHADREGEKWTVINLPALAESNDPLGRKPGEALWPERWSKKALNSKRKAIGPFWWNALYQGRPGHHTSAEWPEEHFGEHIWCHEFPRINELHHRVMAVDPSKGKNSRKGDYSAIVAIGIKDGKLYIDATLNAGRPDESLATASKWRTGSCLKLWVSRVISSRNFWLTNSTGKPKNSVGHRFRSGALTTRRKKSCGFDGWAHI